MTRAAQTDPIRWHWVFIRKIVTQIFTAPRPRPPLFGRWPPRAPPGVPPAGGAGAVGHLDHPVIVEGQVLEPSDGAIGVDVIEVHLPADRGLVAVDPR